MAYPLPLVVISERPLSGLRYAQHLAKTSLGREKLAKKMIYVYVNNAALRRMRPSLIYNLYTPTNLIKPICTGCYLTVNCSLRISFRKRQAF